MQDDLPICLLVVNVSYLKILYCHWTVNVSVYGLNCYWCFLPKVPIAVENLSNINISLFTWATTAQVSICLKVIGVFLPSGRNYTFEDMKTSVDQGIFHLMILLIIIIFFSFLTHWSYLLLSFTPFYPI